MKHMVRGFVCLAFAAGMSFAALAESYTWKGGTSNFEDAENWEPEGKPGAGDSCTISKPESGATALTVNTALNIAALTVGGGNGAGTVKVTFANGLSTNVVAGDVQVLVGGTLTHKANNNAKTYVLNLAVDGNMTIAEGAAVDVDCCGFQQNGPGATTNQGGVYGGRAHGNSMSSYGSIREPTDLGSNGKSGATWAGGGAIMLDVVGTLTVNGTIRSRGGLKTATGGGCGGSGGSIFLKVGKLAGASTGLIDANQSRFDDAVYTGSGGRIAVHQRTAQDWSASDG